MSNKQKNQGNTGQTYQNVMELLVAKEIQRQLRMLPRNIVGYIEPLEVATYALNRLPALYASSQQGKLQQEKRAQQKYREQISIAVRQGLAAVQRDPLRVSTPIAAGVEKSNSQATNALDELEEWLRQLGLLDAPYLSWDNLVPAVKHALYKASKTSIHQYYKFGDNNTPTSTSKSDSDKSPYSYWDNLKFRD